MSTEPHVHVLDLDSIPRLVALRDHLAITPLNSTKCTSTYRDKFTGAEIRYTLDHVSPPERLFALGNDTTILKAPVAVAFGGTVSPSADGFQLAELLAQDCTVRNEALVVGGGVVGIDMAAHMGSLDTGGKTVAVLANPVTLGLHPYSPKRKFFENGILSLGGLLLSEYDTRMDDLSERLLQRDRVITALSDLFVAVECSRDSATVDTAKRACHQGKRVIAIDWSKISKTWKRPERSGCDQLLDQGVAEATPRQCVSSIRDAELMADFHDVVMSLRASPS